MYLSQLLVHKFILEQELDNIKESWIIFKFYLIDLIAPQSKNSLSIGAAAAANYARSTRLRPQVIKKYHKVFADFVKSVQRMPGDLQNFLNTFQNVQIVFDFLIPAVFQFQSILQGLE